MGKFKTPQKSSRHNHRPAKGAFAAVTATGSSRKLPFTGLKVLLFVFVLNDF